MTCIVGLVHDNRVHIGGDSAGVDGRYGLTVRNDRKVFRNGDFVMGFTSSFRMGQLLAFDFNPPKPRAGTDVMAYMVTDFIDAARSRMKSGGYACGCGDQLALGSLRSSRAIPDPEARLREALETAEAFSAGVRGPFFFEASDAAP